MNKKFMAYLFGELICQYVYNKYISLTLIFKLIVIHPFVIVRKSNIPLFINLVTFIYRSKGEVPYSFLLILQGITNKFKDYATNRDVESLGTDIKVQ